MKFLDPVLYLGAFVAVGSFSVASAIAASIGMGSVRAEAISRPGPELRATAANTADDHLESQIQANAEAVEYPAHAPSALSSNHDFRARVAQTCPMLPVVDTVITRAINVGAPTYNAGGHLACYTIYQGAAYHLLYIVQDQCRVLTEEIKKGLEQADRGLSASQKAWTMRRVFDRILGVPTRSEPVPPPKGSTNRHEI